MCNKKLLITESYRELNRRLHSDNPAYGVSGQKYAAVVRQLMDHRQTADVLDYGCGKRTLESALGTEIRNYDPAIEGLDAEPMPAQIVACTDVLEHIEPDCLDGLLAEIRRCTLGTAVLVISTRAAKKFLADGRNTHLIQESGRWWTERLWSAGFMIRQYADMGGELQVLVE